MALVTVLFVVVLVTLILVTFISIAQNDLLSTESYTKGMQADQIALGGLEQIKGDLRSEIIDPVESTVYTSNSISVYCPIAATNAVPQRAGTTFANDMTLIKVSRSGAPFYANGSALASAVNSATNASTDGRYIPASRWSKPLLLTNSFNNIPDWVNFTRTGPRVVTLAQASDATLSNTNYVTGRYAYAVYDVSGLIDINVAGSSTNSTSTALSPTTIGRKGPLALADLTCIPNPVSLGGTSPTLTQAQIDNLIIWRNAATYTSYLTYLTNFASTNGFLPVAPGNNTFLSRQDLIRYASNVGITNAVPYLTTFSREVNAPSWKPTATTGTPTGNTIDYAGTAENSSATNCDIPNVRFSGTGSITHYNSDGSSSTYSVQKGTPLVQQRFSLARLAWLNGYAQSTTAPNSFATAIQSCFGLVSNYNASGAQFWTYAGSPTSTTTPTTAASSIETLSQVASEYREPNFFELLKAAILFGSLGQTPGSNSGGSGTAGIPLIFNESSPPLQDAHIIQIGVNIIDQTTADPYPDTIVFYPGANSTTANGYSNGGYEFYGAKNLPYLTRAIQLLKQNPPTGTATQMYSWVQPELWGPYQFPGTSTVAPYKVPSNPVIQVTAIGGNSLQGGSKPYYPVTYTAAASPLPTGQVNPALQVKLAKLPYYSTTTQYPVPIGLTQTEVPTVVDPTSNLQPGAWSSQKSYSADTSQPVAAIYTGYATYGASYYTFSPSNLSILLQWSSSASGPWHTYSRMENLNYAGSDANLAGTPTGVWFRADPRTDRFGNSFSTYAGWTFPNQALRPSAGPGFPGGTAYPVLYPPSSSHFTWDSSGTKYLGLLTDNNPQDKPYTYYSDPDGVVRRGDGAYASAAEQAGTGTEGFPLSINTGTIADAEAARRPLILNQPFQSVGELGYTFRDLPGKELDFFTAESADAALLDVFSAFDEPTVVAGRISPNVIYPQTIQAVVQGALLTEPFGTSLSPTTLSSTDAASIAQAIATYVQTTPFRNRADLVTGFSPTLNTTLAGSSLAPGINLDKTECEAVMRALGSVANTRTWNLLIDVIGQSGRYPATATSLNDFVVQGERRYWLHLAIDRYTGEIVDEQYEPVTE
jgi:hypothetical protein